MEFQKSNQNSNEEILSLIHISDVLNAMGMKDAKVTSKIDEEGALSIDVEGSNMGILIGKRGQTDVYKRQD